MLLRIQVQVQCLGIPQRGVGELGACAELSVFAAAVVAEPATCLEPSCHWSGSTPRETRAPSFSTTAWCTGGALVWRCGAPTGGHSNLLSQSCCECAESWARCEPRRVGRCPAFAPMRDRGRLLLCGNAADSRGRSGLRPASNRCASAADLLCGTVRAVAGPCAPRVLAWRARGQSPVRALRWSPTQERAT